MAFLLASVKIYTGQKNLHWRRQWRQWQLSGMLRLCFICDSLPKSPAQKGSDLVITMGCPKIFLDSILRTLSEPIMPMSQLAEALRITVIYSSVILVVEYDQYRLNANDRDHLLGQLTTPRPSQAWLCEIHKPDAQKMKISYFFRTAKTRRVHHFHHQYGEEEIWKIFRFPRMVEIDAAESRLILVWNWLDISFLCTLHLWNDFF